MASALSNLIAAPPLSGVTLLCAAMLASACCGPTASSAPRVAAAAPLGITQIAIGPEILHSGVKRFGINLSGQTFYDSGQMLKNLVFRNPGFEGETWQSFLRCRSVTADSCVDSHAWNAWPAGFLNGAHYEVISGARQGALGLVRESDAAANGHGVTVKFTQAVPGLAAGDFLLVRMEKPGDATAGWWTVATGGATISTEFHDLSPATPGKQAVRLDALGAGQYASISSYFDSTEGRSFLQLRGHFALHFRAKAVSGAQTLPVDLSRLDKLHGRHTFLAKDVPLTPTWHDYAFEFSANEDGSAVGTVGLTFSVSHAAVLLDDVELVALSPANPTAFRDEVVATLRDLQPGVLRFMDNGTSFGSKLDDLIATPFARRRGGSLVQTKLEEDIPMGLHESLTVAQAVHAEPWYTLPATTSPAEAAALVEYLAGPASSPYGAKRAALGQAAPWTSVFPVIHLEFGNEMWNDGDFGGAAIADAGAYAARANAVFGAARASQWFRANASKFDLILDGQSANPWLTGQLLQTASQQNSIDFAPYLFGQFNDASSTEAIFGSMFAEPEQEDIGGTMAQQAKLARSGAHPTAPAVYEVNLGTSGSANNTVTQADIDRTVPSIGGAIAVADHMLLMLRELGITTQCLFALPEYSNPFRQPDGSRKTTPLWGSVVDMGGPSNLRRPSFLALQLMNRGLLRNELATHLSGANPTWNQPASANDKMPASQPHLLQVFAFVEGAKRSMILLNLSRDTGVPVAFAGAQAPRADVHESRLTSANIMDSNEYGRKVAVAERTIALAAGAPYMLPPFSITLLEWQVAS
jgi:hypothetical protein